MSRLNKGHQLLTACRRLSNVKLHEQDAHSNQQAFAQTRAASSCVETIRQARPSLDQPVLSSGDNVQFKVPEKETKISNLQNGMKVATENSYGQFVTIGLFPRIGSRFDDGYTPGISHVLERMAFTGSRKYPSRAHVMAELDQYGGLVDCQFHREVGVYTLSVLANGLEKAMEILADVTLHPQISQERLEEAQTAVMFHLEDLDMQANQEQRLADLIHRAAYGDSGLGLPRLCPDDNVKKITNEELVRYLRAKMCPSDMTLAAVNVDHEQFQALAEQYFGTGEPSWGKMATSTEPCAPAVYKPCFVKDARKMERAVVHANQLPDVAHYSMAYRSCSYRDDDFVATCVLNTLMGGGSSFSAGGPGKGLFSRLYTNVLSQNFFVMSAIATNYPYADTGLFTFNGSCSPGDLGKLAHVMSAEVGRLARDPFTEEEVSRAKQQMLSLLFMNLESRAINLEDIGRQVLELGLRENGEQLRQKIVNVSVEDITRVARKLFDSPPAFAALGDVSALPASMT
ncbi:mitochondrial-processing peptidase subunit alpha-like [Sycon ciliatum]|uniref:mitochondrial-processing peptidase subunit alpha-like n=1 Tax=Sycon ciliatum TaxID=27933 RepID=UPI0020A8C18B|eukprot:scpid38350/ scgid18407/ Mitochondrial-processing peptidase subunit alpha; Alpha-MPP; P-55